MKKIVVTGGSGKLGQQVIQNLLARGYETLNLDRAAPSPKLGLFRLADLRSSGDLYEALRDAYGVIHLGAYQAPNLTSDSETFSNNVAATYNVLKAAGDLGVRKAVIASSTAAFGFIYAPKLFPPDYLPLDEKHPSRPQDPYGLSKLVGEQIADAAGRRYPRMTISSLRFPGIIFDFSYEIVRQRWKDPRGRASGHWAYIDARDAANACRLALEAKFTGHEVMIVAAPRSSMREPTDVLMKKYLGKSVSKKSRLAGNWSGVNATKARRLIGFKAEHEWENYLEEN